MHDLYVIIEYIQDVNVRPTAMHDLYIITEYIQDVNVRPVSNA